MFIGREKAGGTCKTSKKNVRCNVNVLHNYYFLPALLVLLIPRYPFSQKE